MSELLDHFSLPVTTIHLLGSEGFIGRSIQRQAGNTCLRCWSHNSRDPDNHFDLLNPVTWKALLDSRPSHVIFLSWPGLPNYRDSFHINRNLPASLELIEKLVSVGTKRLVVAGTCYEYGLQNGPLHEDQITDPINCYGIAKDCLRRVIASRWSEHELQWCWARIFYPYGDGQNPNSLVPSLLQALERGDQTFAMSSGRQVRDFIDVQDVARALLTLAVHQEASGIYNIGSGTPCSVLEIVERVISTHKNTIEVRKGIYQDRPDEPLAFWAKVNRLRALQSSPNSNL